MYFKAYKDTYDTRRSAGRTVVQSHVIFYFRILDILVNKVLEKVNICIAFALYKLTKVNGKINCTRLLLFVLLRVEYFTSLAVASVVLVILPLSGCTGAATEKTVNSLQACSSSHQHSECLDDYVYHPTLMTLKQMYLGVILCTAFDYENAESTGFVAPLNLYYEYIDAIEVTYLLFFIIQRKHYRNPVIVSFKSSDINFYFLA